MTHDETTHFVRKYIDNWRFWITAFGVALALVFYLLFSLSQRQNKEAAARITANQISSNNERQRLLEDHKGQVQQCFLTVKNQPVVDGFLQSHADLINNSILTITAAIKAEPEDPLTPIRKQSKARLEKARVNLKDLRKIVNMSRQSKSTCLKLAKEYHLNSSSYLKLLDAKESK